MKKTTFLLAAIFTATLSNQAQTVLEDSTEVSGTWTKNNSPYLINGMATIPSGSTLVIEPGVEIRFKTGNDVSYSGDNMADVGWLCIKGKLVAEGTSNQRIIFTRQGDDGNWGCIAFLPDADRSSSFKYCKIQYANQIGGILSGNYEGAVSFRNLKINISNSEITLNKSSGIFCYQHEYFSILNCIVAENGGNGFCFRWYPNSQKDTVKLINNTIVRNKGAGLYTWGARCHAINCVFWGNSKSLGLNNERLLISFTLVEEEDLPGEDWYVIGKSVIYNFDPRLDSNFSPSFYSPCINAGMADTSGLNLPATDHAGNTRIKLGIVDLGAVESTAGKYTCITKPDPLKGYQVGSSVDICWRSNAAAINLDYTSDGGTTWKNLVSGTPNDGHHAWNIPTDESEEFNIRISDSSDNSVFDVCDSNMVIFSSVIPKNVILTGKLPVQFSPYFIDGPIAVPQNDSLVIDPGCILKFKTGVGLTVKGKLVARGTHEEPIVFTRQGDEGYWDRIVFSNTDIASVLEYCTVRYASGSSGGAITNSSKRLTLLHSKIINNERDGIYSVDSYPEIRNCIIAFNGGYGLYLIKGNYILPTKLINNSIVGNRNIGLFVYQTNCQVINSVFWGNEKSISTGYYGSVSVSYSLVQEEKPSAFSGNLTNGKGLIYALDPQFMDLAESDFHLKPTSPGIDQGDPLSEYKNEPEDNGDRINLGAYGNTPEATRTDYLPRITSISAYSGHMSGDDTLMIKGKYFLNEKQNGRILFKNTEAVRYLFWSEDSLVCVTPPHLPEKVSIHITNKDLRKGYGFECYAYQPPVIDQNIPLFLKYTGNDPVTLSGKMFGLKRNGLRILFNNAEASAYKNWSDTLVVITSPPNTEGLTNLTFKINDSIYYTLKGLFYYSKSDFIQLCDNMPDTLKKGQACLINCPVTINAGDTLVIEPGVVIIARHDKANPVSIIVDGSVIAKGTINDSIKIISIPDEKNLWGGIILNNHGIFDFCAVRNAATAILQENGASVIGNSAFKENGTGLHFYGKDKQVFSQINKCSISRNITGIKAEASGNKSYGYAGIDVTSSSISHNDGNAVELSGHGYITSGSVPRSTSSRASGTVQNSVIAYNKGYPLYLHAQGFTAMAIPFDAYRHGNAALKSYNNIIYNNNNGIFAERVNKNPETKIWAEFYNSNFWCNNTVMEGNANNVFFYNSGLWDNQVSGVPTVTCDSLVYESCNLNDLKAAEIGHNNISSDPKYTSPGEGDFNLQQGSPCIDAGNNSYVDFPADFSGKIRTWNATGKESANVDIGAFEYDSPLTANRDIEKEKEFSSLIFPNPSHGTFHVRFNSEPGQKLILKLVNQSGQTIDIRYVRSTNMEHTEQFDISHLGKGIYFMIIQSERDQTTGKILIR